MAITQGLGIEQRLDRLVGEVVLSQIQHLELLDARRMRDAIDVDVRQATLAQLEALERGELQRGERARHGHLEVMVAVEVELDEVRETILPCEQTIDHLGGHPHVGKLQDLERLQVRLCF